MARAAALPNTVFSLFSPNTQGCCSVEISEIFKVKFATAHPWLQHCTFDGVPVAPYRQQGSYADHLLLISLTPVSCCALCLL